MLNQPQLLGRERQDEVPEAIESLVRLRELMDWENFPSLLEDFVLVRIGGCAGRLPAGVGFAAGFPVAAIGDGLQTQLQFQLPDRRSFKRFPSLRIDSKIPRNSDLEISQPLEHVQVFQ